MKTLLRIPCTNRVIPAILILLCAIATWTPLFAGTTAPGAPAPTATVLYDALNGETQGADYVFGDGPLYVSFSTGSSPVALSDVMAKLTAAQGGASGSITVGLYSDAATRPGNLLVQIGTLADSMVSPSSYANFDFPVSPVYQLKANTRYWIGFISVNQTVIHLAWTDDLSGTGVGTEYLFFQGSVRSNAHDQAAYQLRITGTAITVGAPTSITAVSGNNQTGVVGTALAAPLVVAVTDANKNPIPGVLVTFNGTNATVNPPSAQTDSSGQASTQVTLGNTPGPATVTANVTGLTSISFSATVTPGTLPLITSVENAASSNAPGLPNAAIAQGAIFNMYGFNMGPSTLVVSSNPFQSTNLSGTSASVTINGQKVDVLMYYTSDKQVSGLLPSNTPVGTGTITVTYNGNAGMPAPITVVQSNLGIFTITQDGAGVGIVTFPDYSLVSDLPATNCGGPFTTCGAANPGDVLTLWATGLGPVSAPDQSGPQPGNMPNIPLSLWVGGVQATVNYQGRSGCCIGEDEIFFTVPANAPTGCAVPLLVQIGNQISNNVVIPVASGSRTCTPTQSNLAGNVFQQLTTSSSALGFGDLVLRRQAANCGTPPCQPPYQDQAKADFASITIPAADQPFVISYLDVPPVGTCVVQNKANPVTPYTIAGGLDAGAITLAGPKGSMPLTETAGTAGSPTTYLANLGPGNYLAAGNYTFSSTGKDLPAFNVPVTIPALPAWTNQPSGTIDRSSPLNITWTAGASNTYVQIQGSSYTDNTGTIGATFSCIADANALSFAVPVNILEQLPAGPGTLFFITGLFPANFSVSGLTYGSVQSYFQSADYVTYK
ncbi:MAG TPA: Ig-like domain-containing protein [Bryobacteraceae bacterium]|nr:Ig-like domain-containing protein [Bryobacteraceae bacterium]